MTIILTGDNLLFVTQELSLVGLDADEYGNETHNIDINGREIYALPDDSVMSAKDVVNHIKNSITTLTQVATANGIPDVNMISFMFDIDKIARGEDISAPQTPEQ